MQSKYGGNDVANHARVGVDPVLTVATRGNMASSLFTDPQAHEKTPVTVWGSCNLAC